MQVLSPRNSSVKIRNLKIIRILSMVGGIGFIVIGFFIWNIAQTDQSLDELIGIILIAVGLVDMPLEYLFWTWYINKRITIEQTPVIASK